LTPDRADIPIRETIDELVAIRLVELENDHQSFYRVPTPVQDTQHLLAQLDISIPPLIPKTGSSNALITH